MPITFSQTTDYELIKAIITHPSIWPAVSDDYASLERFEPVRDPAFLYVTATDGDELLGVFLFAPTNSICLEVHTCLLPNSWGAKAKAAGREVIGWIWQNTGAHRIITNVPAYNRLALRFARQSGLTDFGNNKKSYMKHGSLHDQIMLGISKAELCQ